MSWEDEAYRGFACPQERFYDEFLEFIAVLYARQLCRRFLERFGEDLSHRGNRLTSFLTSWLKKEVTFDQVWDFSFGEIKQALFSDSQSNYVHAAAELALRLQYCGLIGEWSLQLTSPVRLRWGKWLLPTADWIAVSGNEQEVSIRSRYEGLEKETIFRRDSDGWKAEEAEQILQISTMQRQISLLLPNTLNDMALGDLHPNLATDLTPVDLLAASDGAFMLLRNHAPIYLPWVERVVRDLIPLRSEGNIIFSGSRDNTPGVIDISFPAKPEALAELLVHEATHQYFYLLCRAGSVDDGSDPTLYYSPFKKQGRPIKFILLAYHAFANVLLLHRIIRESGLSDSEYCLQREEELLPQLKELETALRRTRALTPLGNALWEPLMERL